MSFQIIPEKTYTFTKENLDYVFMSNKEKVIYNLQKDIRYIDSFLGKPKNKVMFSALAISLGLIFYANPVMAAELNGIDKIGMKFLRYSRMIGYWVCLIKAIMCVIKAALEEDIFSCWKKVVGYIIAFASLYFIPDLFNAVKGI